MNIYLIVAIVVVLIIVVAVYYFMTRDNASSASVGYVIVDVPNKDLFAALRSISLVKEDGEVVPVIVNMQRVEPDKFDAFIKAKENEKHMLVMSTTLDRLFIRIPAGFKELKFTNAAPQPGLLFGADIVLYSADNKKVRKQKITEKLDVLNIAL